jgi:hypothetical protein
MKKIMILGCAVALMACGAEKKSEIIINEQNHLNEAYNLSADLAMRVKDATTYEEFRAAADELEAYEEAFRTQIGGESYIIFLEECNAILNE